MRTRDKVTARTIWIVASMFAPAVCPVNACAQEYSYPYDSFKDRDPLKPLVSEHGDLLIRERKEMGEFLLQGIIYAPPNSKVIINNEMFSEGDSVSGYTIKKIEPYRVVFDKEGEESILKWEG